MWSWSIASACALDGERFALLCYEDDVAYDDPQRVLTLRLVDGHAPARTLALHGEYVRICQVKDTKASVAALSSDGALDLIDFASARIASERIGIAGQQINPYGALTTIRQIAEHLYACGMGGQVHQRLSPGNWRLISKDLCSENIYERWFSNIDGSGPSFVLATGLEGALYFFDGHGWRKIETNTSAPLGEMAFSNDDKIYIAGAQSVLLYGSPQSGFARVGLSSRDHTLYTICRFSDRLFIGTERGVFEYDERTRNIQAVDTNTDGGDIILLQAAGDIMWAFGSKFVRRYDGTAWTDLGRNL